MKMKRNLWLFILVISTMVSSVSAQSFKQRFKKILGKDKSELALNATSLPKPYININNNIVLSDTIDFNVIEDNIVFINALSYTIKQGEKGKRNIGICRSGGFRRNAAFHIRYGTVPVGSCTGADRP